MATIANFVTVPVELLKLAHACDQSLRRSGYSREYERSEEHFPEAATILAKRSGEQHFYLFMAKVKEDRIRLWTGYGRSCGKPTFIVFCVPENTALSAKMMLQIRKTGAGITTIDSDGTLTALIQPVDLSVNIELPPLKRHRPSTKRELQAAYDKFQNGHWRDGFEEACKIAERCARKHLIREVKASQVIVRAKGGATKVLAPGKVSRMTLGALALAFCNKLYPSPLDSLLCTGLKRINPDRISVVHQIRTAKREKHLRESLGRHMWTIDNLLRNIPAK